MERNRRLDAQGLGLKRADLKFYGWPRGARTPPGNPHWEQRNTAGSLHWVWELFPGARFSIRRTSHLPERTNEKPDYYGPGRRKTQFGKPPNVLGAWECTAFGKRLFSDSPFVLAKKVECHVRRTLRAALKDMENQ